MKNRNVLGSQISSYHQEVLDAYSEEQFEAALDMFLSLYRSIRYSINPRFELELAVSRLFRLRYMYSNAEVLRRLTELKNDLISGKITPVSAPEPAPAPAPVPSVEPVSEPEPAPVEEPAPIEEPAPVKEPALVAKQWTEEDLRAVLPQGTGSFRVTDNGIELEFGSRFYYNNALSNRDAIVAGIHSVTGNGVNVVLSFSEVLAQERQKEVQAETRRRAEEERLNSQKEDLFADLLDAFDGKEVR